MATADIDLEWGGDIVLDSTGDVKLVTGTAKIRQRVLRRFLTTARETDSLGRVTVLPEYMWHPDYGGSARHLVDAALSREELTMTLQQNLTAQARQEADVALDPAPEVTVTAIPNGVAVDAVVVQQDGSQVQLSNVRIKTS